MLNRLVALLILVWIFSWVYFLYYYFFVLNKWNITINSNVWWYEVSLYNSDLKTSFKTTCLEKKCELVDIAPFKYEISISKKWYKDISENIDIENKSSNTFDIVLEKDLLIQKIEKWKELIWSWTLTTAKEKIEELRKKKYLETKYLFFDFWEKWYFYFNKNDDNTLSFYRDLNSKELKIYDFEIVNQADIWVFLINNSLYKILVQYDKKAYIFDLNTWTSTSFDFYPKVNYVKIDWNIVSIVTDLWTYLYDLNTENIEYFNFFKDFLYYWEDSYLWVIYAGEEDKKKNYSLGEYKNNLIVKYNFKTKEIKVLKQTDINIKKILKEENNIYFYDEVWDKYLITNID